MSRLPYIINGKDEVIVIRTKRLLRQIINKGLYKVQYGFLQLRDIKYKTI